MNLKILKNGELHDRMKSLRMQELKLCQVILNHIIEVDRRKLFLEMAYPSLFEYLTSGIVFTAASAQRRIDAARLVRQIPELGAKIESGAITLTQIGKIQSASRALKKVNGEAANIESKKAILNQSENKSAQETDLIIAQVLDMPILNFEKKIIQKDESVRIELTLSKEEMAQISSAKELLSHSLESSDIKDLLLYLAGKVIKQKTKVSQAAKTESSVSHGVQRNDFANLVKGHGKGDINRVSAANRTSKVGDVTSAQIRNSVFKRDLCCQFKDSNTGKMCGSRYFLEIDHIEPKFAGGTNHIDNLRVLCSSHNKFRYQAGR